MTQIPPRISALLNQKGGVGKTTSTVSIGAAIALLGRRTLLIDLDPQAHLSLHLGVDGSSVGKTVYDALVEPDCDIRDCLVQVRDNLWLLPSTTDLAGAETELAAHPDRNRILRERFEEIRGEFDFVLIDCPPSLSVLTLNGLCLADEVVVPMQAQFLAMQGLTKLLETVEILTQSLNPTLKVGGVVLCMHETQTSHSREVVQELAGFFDEHVGSGMPWDGAKVFMPAVRRNIKLAEAPSFGQTIFDYAPWCPGAIDYRALGERFVLRRREAALARAGNRPAGAPGPAARQTAVGIGGLDGLLAHEDLGRGADHLEAAEVVVVHVRRRVDRAQRAIQRQRRVRVGLPQALADLHLHHIARDDVLLGAGDRREVVGVRELPADPAFGQRRVFRLDRGLRQARLQLTEPAPGLRERIGRACRLRACKVAWGLCWRLHGIHRQPG